MSFLVKTIKNVISEAKNFFNETKNNEVDTNGSFKSFIKLIIYFSLINFFYYQSSNNLNVYKAEIKNHNEIIELNIDNKIRDNFYERNIDYSSYSTNIKSIAIYFPNIYLDNYWNLISSSQKKNKFNKPLEYYQKIKEISKKDFSTNDNKVLGKNYFEYNFIFKQIKLAKSHGIYGFGIYIYWYSGNYFFDKYINVFLVNRCIEFHYLFIFNNRNIDNKYHKNIIIKQYNKSLPEELITQFKTYFLDKRYIKINSNPVVCIDDNLKRRKKLKSTILSWRKIAKKLGIGELFIIGSLKSKKYNVISKYKKIFNAGYELLPSYLLKEDLLVNFNDNSTFFSGMIYKGMNFSIFNNFSVFRGSSLENKIKIKKNTIFGDYYPEHFFIMNKLLINWTTFYHNESDNLLFINAWNNYLNGAYLEPNPQFGYASINSVSKALFNLSFINQTYNLINLVMGNSVAVQVHVFYADLINEVISNINNIPVNFDLYITTNTIRKKLTIEEYVKKYSKANNYNIKLVENKGRDIYPLLLQMKKVWHNYKYFCHIHTKKSMHDPNYGLSWRHYLYKNILGSTEVISSILTDFENDEKLGFIFPETFYEAKVHALKMKQPLIDSINFLLNKIFKGYKMGNLFDFPAGDMFWAKFKAVYQIFRVDFSKDICQEGKPLTLLYALERIWLYIVKLNGYYYKKTCDYY